MCKNQQELNERIKIDKTTKNIKKKKKEKRKENNKNQSKLNR